MSDFEAELDPGGDPPEDDRNEQVPDSPVPDPTDGGADGAEDVPEAD
jgi:hypothetical protein